MHFPAGRFLVCLNKRAFTELSESGIELLKYPLVNHPLIEELT